MHVACSGACFPLPSTSAHHCQRSPPLGFYMLLLLLHSLWPCDSCIGCIGIGCYTPRWYNSVGLKLPQFSCEADVEQDSPSSSLQNHTVYAVA